jgi:hypothetical protein
VEADSTEMAAELGEGSGGWNSAAQFTHESKQHTVPRKYAQILRVNQKIV